MLRIAALSLLSLPLLPFAASEAPAESVPGVAVHCQVPCGIYGDKIRIDLMMEDAATIAKGMKMLQSLGAEESSNFNQIVRWTMNKEQHAANIQETVASYWLAQRIKAPKDEAGQAKYVRQLMLMHNITVAAMKCKQGTDSAWVENLRTNVLEFSKTYFKQEDLKHIQSHHGDHKH
ncbi:MAG: superoxide dismutase [Planctomycetota bacterium]|nr:MAG: superoxide dismutase [Planctomycetota bacterium]